MKAEQGTFLWHCWGDNFSSDINNTWVSHLTGKSLLVQFLGPHVTFISQQDSYSDDY